MNNPIGWKAAADETVNHLSRLIRAETVNLPGNELPAIQVYGFTPGLLPPEFPTMTLGHGHHECLPVSFIASGLPVLWHVVEEFCVG